MKGGKDLFEKSVENSGNFSEYFVPSRPVRRRDERDFFDVGKCFFNHFGGFQSIHSGEFVRLGGNKGKRDLIIPQLFRKLEIGLYGIKANVDDQKNVFQRL